MEEQRRPSRKVGWFLVIAAAPVEAIVVVFGATLGGLEVAYYTLPVLVGLATGVWILAKTPKNQRDEVDGR